MKNDKGEDFNIGDEIWYPKCVSLNIDTKKSFQLRSLGKDKIVGFVQQQGEIFAIFDNTLKAFLNTIFFSYQGGSAKEVEENKFTYIPLNEISRDKDGVLKGCKENNLNVKELCIKELDGYIDYEDNSTDKDK